MSSQAPVSFFGKSTSGFCLGLLTCAACLVGAETPAPTPPQPAPNPAAAPATETINWTNLLADFQSSDAAKQQAAAKIFLQNGPEAYRLLANLLKSPDTQIVKRTTELRQQIEQQSTQVFNDAIALSQKVEAEPLTVAALQELQQSWLRAAGHCCDTRMKQACLEQAKDLQRRLKEFEDTSKKMAALDAQLQGLGQDSTVMRASVQLQRANGFRILQRDEEALQAAHAAVDAGGKDCRLTPSALKFLAELYAQRKDYQNVEAVCNKIIKDHQHSLEVKFAQQSLAENLVAETRWDDAVKQTQEFINAFPLDEDAQNQAYSLLDSLAGEDDYTHACALSDWLVKNLPLDRLVADIPRLAGQCDEYLLKDFDKAEKMYRVLKDKYPDMVNLSEVDAALARVRLKLQGKFPAEPASSDEGPAGALAKFLKAFRKRDSKAVAEVVPKKEAANYEDLLAKGEGVREAVFADFVVTGIKLDEKKESAVLSIDHYDAVSEKPAQLTQQAVKEDGQWKIRWNAPADTGGGGIKLNLNGQD